MENAYSATLQDKFCNQTFHSEELIRYCWKMLYEIVKVAGNADLVMTSLQV